MSDSLAEFKRKNDAQFALLAQQTEEIGRLFISKMAWHVVVPTPGPNLQLPNTEYIATGRLRAGWRWSETYGPADNWEDGPYSDTGEETLQEIAAAVHEGPLVPISYLWNNVGYGRLVHDGLGRHPFPRPWVDIAATYQQTAADEARQEVMGR